MKLIGLIILGFCPALTGQYLSVKLKKRVEVLEKLELMFSLIENNISFLSLPSSELVQILSVNTELNCLGFLRDCNKLISEGVNFRESWLISLSAKKNTQFLNRSDVALLRLFCENFGTSDKKGEISNCRFCKSLLVEHIVQARLHKEKYGNIFVGLGLFISIALILLLY